MVESSVDMGDFILFFHGIMVSRLVSRNPDWF